MKHLPLPKAGHIDHIFHVSDIHIRTGDKVASRYDEYMNVFKNLANRLKEHPSVKNGTCVAVATGDMFHDKVKLSACSVKLFSTFVRTISSLMPLYLIRGNHDYQQDKPEIDDLIQSVIQCYDIHVDKKEDDVNLGNIYYMNSTDHYIANNIGFGVVSVQDTLVDGTSSGKQLDKLPLFPSPSEFPNTVTTTVALFHGTIIHSTLQNYSSSTEGYPLHWFDGYDIGCFGDVHLQQIHNIDDKTSGWHSTKITWGYPGSLIQQNFGEEIINHGVFDWNIKDKTVYAMNIKNDYGKLKLKYVHDEWKLNNNKPLDAVLTDSLCPSSVAIRTYGNTSVESINALKMMLKSNNVYCEDLLQYQQSLEYDETQGENSLDNEEIVMFNTKDNWIDFIEKNTKDKQMTTDWKSWILDAHNAVIPMSEHLPQSLVQDVNKKNVEVSNFIENHEQKYESKRRVFKFLYLEWSYLLCFGETNHFNFGDNEEFLNMIKGRNGTGKTSFLEVLSYALFGKGTPTKTCSGDTAAVIHRNKPNGKKAYTLLHVEVDGAIYKIYRGFRVHSSNSNKLNSDEVTINSDILDYPKSGSKTTSTFIKEHICDMDYFLQYIMMPQASNGDFFNLPASEQINMIESSQNIDSINFMNNILDMLIKSHSHIKSLVTGIYNDHMSNMEEYDESKIVGIEKKIEGVNTEIARLKATLDKLKPSLWKDINETDFMKDFNAKLKELKKDIDNIKLDKSYNELLLEKGKFQYVKDEINSLKHVKYDADMEVSKTYVEEHNAAIEQKEKHMKDVEKYKSELKKLKEQHRVKKTEIRELNKSNIHPTTDMNELKKSISKYNKLDEQRDTIVSNIKKIEDLFNKQTLKLQTIDKLTNEIEVVKREIEKIDSYDHPFNPNCEQCKKQLWKLDRDDKEALLLKLQSQLDDEEEKLEKLLKGKDMDKKKDSLQTNKKHLEYLESIDINRLNKDLEKWDKFNKVTEEIESKVEEESQIDEEINVLEDKIETEYDAIQNITILNDPNTLYMEHSQLLEKQHEWLKINDLDKIEKELKLHEERGTLEKLQEYWQKVKKYKNKYSEYVDSQYKVEVSKENLRQHEEEHKDASRLKQQYQNMINQKTFIDELELRTNTLQAISSSFKDFRKELFNTSILPFIVGKINQLISSVSDNTTLSLSGELITTNALRNAKTKVVDSLSWKINYDGCSLPLDKASGFQRCMCGFGMTSVMTKINCAIRCRQIFLDEQFTAFDEAHLSKAHEMLNSLKSDYDNIYLVSHLEELHNNIQSKIMIERHGSFSRINFGDIIISEESQPKKRGRKKKENVDDKSS